MATLTTNIPVSTDLYTIDATSYDTFALTFVDGQVNRAQFPNVSVTFDFAAISLPADLSQWVTVTITQPATGRVSVKWAGNVRVDPGVSISTAASTATTVYAFTSTGRDWTVFPSSISGVASDLSSQYGLSWANVPPSLQRFVRSVSNWRNERCTIVGYGDSIIEGTGPDTYDETVSGRFAQALRDALGVTGTGRGFIPAAWPGYEATDFPQDRIPSTTGTATKATGATAALGPGRKSLQMSTNATVTFDLGECTGYDIYYAKAVSSGLTWSYNHGAGANSVSGSTTRTTLTAQANSGQNQIVVATVPADWYPGVQLVINPAAAETAYIASISGTTVTLVGNLASTWASGTQVGAHSNGGYLVEVRDLAAAERTLTITATAGITIEGVISYNGDEDAGICYVNAGHGGIRADQLQKTGNTDHSMQALVKMAPSLLLVSLMINDSAEQTPTEMTGNFDGLLDDLATECTAQGVPFPSIAWVLSYEIDPTQNRDSGVPWQDYQAAAYAWAAADDHGPGGTSAVYLVDLGWRMPRTDLSTTLYIDDDVHPTAAGSSEYVNQVIAALPLRPFTMAGV